MKFILKVCSFDAVVTAVYCCIPIFRNVWRVLHATVPAQVGVLRENFLHPGLSGILEFLPAVSTSYLYAESKISLQHFCGLVWNHGGYSSAHLIVIALTTTTTVK